MVYYFVAFPFTKINCNTTHTPLSRIIIFCVLFWNSFVNLSLMENYKQLEND